MITSSPTVRQATFTALAAAAALLMACGGGGLEVSHDQYGDAWPFVAEQGVLDCVDSTRGRLGVALFRDGEKTYGLTTLAQIEGYPSIEPLWRNHPDFSGEKMDLQPMIDLALTLC